MERSATTPLPLYQQFKILIEQKIASGEWPPGTTLPPELTLTKAYGISRITVRQALDELVTEGRIRRERGRGTFVLAPKIAQTLAHLTGFAEELALRGLQPAVTVLAHGIVRATERVAGALDLPSGSEVLHIRRLIRVANEPLLLDDSYFVVAMAPILGTQQAQSSTIYQALEAAGHAPAEGEQRLEAVPIPRDMAELLGVDANTPGLLITRVAKNRLGEPMEFTTALYRGDRYEYAIHLRRK
jgi:GntR family transcriptional regulator